jgi:hypothetical protein
MRTVSYSVQVSEETHHRKQSTVSALPPELDLQQGGLMRIVPLATFYLLPDTRPPTHPYSYHLIPHETTQDSVTYTQDPLTHDMGVTCQDGPLLLSLQLDEKIKILCRQ